jgi:molecular chaperone GrpE
MNNEVEITPAGSDAKPPSPEATSPEPPVTPEAYAKVLEEKKELYDRLLRKQAELENSRKRTQKEMEEFRQRAAEDLIRSLLPTLDGFERALARRDPAVPESYYQGLELIYREMREVLGRAGLVAIETTGKLFDPHLHQAVETVEAPGHREHEIVGELQRGYKLRHRLLRPAIVKVAVGSKPGTPPAGGGRPGH